MFASPRLCLVYMCVNVYIYIVLRNATMPRRKDEKEEEEEED